MLKTRFKTVLRFIFAVLILILPSFCISDLKAQGKIEVKLAGIQEENRQIPESEWNNLQFLKGNKIYVSFNAVPATSKKIFYRVLLDTGLIESNLLDNFITLKDLSTGIHIVKITAVTDEGTESEPLLLTIKITDPQAPVQVVPQEEPKESKTDAGTFSNPVYFYAASGLSIILLAVVIILLMKKKEPKTESPLAIELKKSQEEYVELYNSHKRLKDELKDLKDYNEYLKKQKSELETTVKNLESVNVNLLDQKEKLTESKRQLELLHAQKDELFAMAIHDIKNPVSAIRGYIELLNSYDLNATEQNEIMTSLVNSSENIVKLTQSMCTIIAQDRPEPTLKFQPTSIKKIIDEICNQNISYAKAKSIKLFNKSSVGLPDIAVDEVKIQEVIENLVNNAIKYGPPETTVEVRTYIKGKFLTVEVQDTGVGIPEEDLKRVFQKGAVLTPKPTGLEQSSGLGLWIVKRIIEEHNGKVWVTSKSGNGSTFGFELPMEVKDRKATMY